LGADQTAVTTAGYRSSAIVDGAFLGRPTFQKRRIRDFLATVPGSPDTPVEAATNDEKRRDR
jgi:hypothetical protein